MYPNRIEHRHSGSQGERDSGPGTPAVSHVRHRRPTAIAAPHQELVERAEAHLRAEIGTRVSLSTLCRVVGVSERGLRNAFYDVRAMSPTRWVRAERLQDVRRVLSEAGGESITVTGVATDYGFFELGRFAGRYKAAFGEAPSETLHRTGRKSGAEQRRKTGELAYARTS